MLQRSYHIGVGIDFRRTGVPLHSSQFAAKAGGTTNAKHRPSSRKVLFIDGSYCLFTVVTEAPRNGTAVRVKLQHLQRGKSVSRPLMTRLSCAAAALTAETKAFAEMPLAASSGFNTAGRWKNPAARISRAEGAWANK